MITTRCARLAVSALVAVLSMLVVGESTHADDRVHVVQDQTSTRALSREEAVDAFPLFEWTLTEEAWHTLVDDAALSDAQTEYLRSMYDIYRTALQQQVEENPEYDVLLDAIVEKYRRIPDAGPGEAQVVFVGTERERVRLSRRTSSFRRHAQLTAVHEAEALFTECLGVLAEQQKSKFERAVRTWRRANMMHVRHRGRGDRDWDHNLDAVEIVNSLQDTDPDLAAFLCRAGDAPASEDEAKWATRAQCLDRLHAYEVELDAFLRTHYIEMLTKRMEAVRAGIERDDARAARLRRSLKADWWYRIYQINRRFCLDITALLQSVDGDRANRWSDVFWGTYCPVLYASTSVDALYEQCVAVAVQPAVINELYQSYTTHRRTLRQRMIECVIEASLPGDIPPVARAYVPRFAPDCAVEIRKELASLDEQYMTHLHDSVKR